MPTSGAVYQPTTVTYEQQPNEQRWSCPMSYFSRRLTNGINRTTCWQIGLLVFGVLAFITGLILVITGSVQYSDGPSTTPGTSQPDSMGLVIAGAIIMAIGLLQTGVFAWVVLRGGWARGKDTGAGGGAAALTALNPSTDPLVAAQYAPVRDAPPAPDDERRNLMDNKDCLSSAEESDKMLEGRPTVA